MATKTFEELKQLAIQIRDEKTNKANTATRIGTQMIEHLNKLEQEYYNKDGVAEQLKTRDNELARLDKMTTEYNVSVLHPTSGSGGSNKYTLETAIAQVPSKYRSVGIKCAFINDSGKPECWKYQGGSWVATSFVKEADGGNKILEWKTDAATTRKQVAQSERKSLLQISYRNADGDIVNEQYIGTTFTDTGWAKDSNWDRLISQNQLTDFESQVNEHTVQNFPGLKGLQTNNEIVDYVNYLEAVIKSFAQESKAIALLNESLGEIASFFPANGVSIDSSKTLCKYKIDISKYPEAKYFKVFSYNNTQYKDSTYLKTIYKALPHELYKTKEQSSEALVLSKEVRNDFDNYKESTDKYIEEQEYVIAYYPKLKDSEENNVTSGGAAEGSATLLDGENVYRIKANLFAYTESNYALALRNENNKVIKSYTFADIGIKKEDGSYDIDFIITNNDCKYISMWSFRRGDTTYIQLIGRADGRSFQDNKEYNTIVNLLASVYVENNNKYYNKGFKPFRDGNDIYNTNKVKWGFTPEDLSKLNTDILYLYYKGVRKDQYSDYVYVSDGSSTQKFSVTENYTDKFIKIDLSSFDKSKNIFFNLTANGNFVEGKNVTDLCLSTIPIKNISKIVDGNSLRGVYGKDMWYWDSENYSLQEAIEYTKEFGTLLIPNGVYEINSRVLIEKPIQIIGKGKVILYGGYAYKTASLYQDIPDVYQAPVNQEGYGWRNYDGDVWIYQDNIADEITSIENKDIHPIYRKKTHRLPMTRIWKTNDIQKVITEQSDGKLYFTIQDNTIIFRAVKGSVLADNPVYLAKNTNDPYKHSGEQLLYISSTSEKVLLQSIQIRYGALAIMGGNTILKKIQIFGVSQSTAYQISNNKKTLYLEDCESGGNQEDGFNGGASPIIEGDLISGEVDVKIINSWFHDCQGDGISEHGKGFYNIENCLFEFNGISGATPCGGDSVYSNCIFRYNGDGQRAGLWVLPSDSDNVSVTAIGCCSYDNKGADYGAQNASIHVNNSKIILSLYNCSSLGTSETENYTIAASAATNRYVTIGLYNLVTNRTNKIKTSGTVGNITIIQAPTVS